MEVHWLWVATEEAREARAHYDGQHPGLGERFLAELRATVGRITALPHSWPQTEPPVRRALVNRFPYLIHYVVDGDEIVILGVYHARRRPISWRDRLERDRRG